MPNDRNYVIPPPRNAERFLGSFRVQLLVAISVAALVALIAREPVSRASFWSLTFGTGFGTLLTLHFIGSILFVPRPNAGEVHPDQAKLTSSITSASLTTYAISSNWLTLWRSSTFRYYLHLDATASLINYSRDHHSVLQSFTLSEEAQQVFYSDGLDLLERIGRGEPPLTPHRIRILIYPEWAYDAHRDEILRLIRSHSAARIPCIPLVADALYHTLEGPDRDCVAAVVRALGQSYVDKSPPSAPLAEWYLKRRLQKGRKPHYEWLMIFPDFLLVDVEARGDKSALWWYFGEGRLDSRRSRDQLTTDAYEVFKLICRLAKDALWGEYVPEQLGRVPVVANHDRLQSESFFAHAYYKTWLDWIEANRPSNTDARKLAAWMRAEREAMEQFAASLITNANGNGDSGQERSIRFLDIGCGAGRDILTLLKAHPELEAIGLDIIDRNAYDANDYLREAGLKDRARVVIGDAAVLPTVEEESIDFAVCMTNTLGNLREDKQEALMKRLAAVLRPRGRAFFSVYGPHSVSPRLETYHAIGLNAIERNGTVQATEGLVSQHFTAEQLWSLVERNGLRVVGPPRDAGSLGLTCIVERR